VESRGALEWNRGLTEMHAVKRGIGAYPRSSFGIDGVLGEQKNPAGGIDYL